MLNFNRYKIVKDPVHGYIKIYEHEIPVVDSHPFQRLRRVKQLAVADLVYPGAVHTRFSHSLGVAHVIEVMVREALSKLGLRQSEIDTYVALMRIVALLHDVGHGPYSHVFEDYVLYPRKVNHEIVGARIIENHDELRQSLDRILKEIGYDVRDIARAIAATDVSDWPFKSSIANGASEKALFYMIKGAFCADIIDYLLRDSYFTGAEYGRGIDWHRLAHFLHIEGDRLAIDSRAIEVFDQIIIARLFMFSTVYYHKTVRAATKFIGNILRRIDREKLIDFDEAISNPKKYIELDDYSILVKDGVRDLPEVRQFLSREIPYRAVAEHRINLGEGSRAIETLISMSKSYIETMVSELARDRGIDVEPEVHFFIDTPKLPLNPMLSDDIVFIKDKSGEVYPRSVLDLGWFHIPKTVAVIRLYVDRRTIDDRKAEELRRIFIDVVEGRRSEIRSFY